MVTVSWMDALFLLWLLVVPVQMLWFVWSLTWEMVTARYVCNGQHAWTSTRKGWICKDCRMPHDLVDELLARTRERDPFDDDNW